ncbi:MAG: hypothetical protein ACRC4M_04760 [Mycoplasma sp.]
MGQRLTIQIKENGNDLILGYYHWGAFTRTAYYFSNKLIESILKNKDWEDKQNTLIKCFQRSHAGLENEDIEEGHGIIIIDKEEIKKKKEIEEYSIIIDLNFDNILESEFNFDVFDRFDKEEYNDEDFLEYKEIVNEGKLKDWKVIMEKLLNDLENGKVLKDGEVVKEVV